MKRDWIKLNVDLLHDPRYGTLTDDLWRLMIQLNLLAGEMDQDGLLPDARDMAWMLRIGTGTLQIALHHLSGRGLVHSTQDGWVVTDFKENQAAPNSTERSREYRKRLRSAAGVADESRDNSDSESTRSATQKKTPGASEMQLSRRIPVSQPVPKPVSNPGLQEQISKTRHRERPKQSPAASSPVEKPVDNPVEKGRKISDVPLLTTSTSSLIKSFKTSLKIKPNLVVEPNVQTNMASESEKIRPGQEEYLDENLNLSENPPLDGSRKEKTTQSQPDRSQAKDIPGDDLEPVE